MNAPSPALVAMKEALRQAAETFRDYEKVHLDKGTAEGRFKAARNADFAERCEAALSLAQQEGASRDLSQAAGGVLEGGELAAVREQLRTAWMRIQQAKRGGKPDLQPVWDAINLIPAALHHLDGMPEFERDVEAEEAEQHTPSPEQGESGQRDELVRKLEDIACKAANGFLLNGGEVEEIEEAALLLADQATGQDKSGEEADRTPAWEIVRRLFQRFGLTLPTRLRDELASHILAMRQERARAERAEAQLSALLAEDKSAPGEKAPIPMVLHCPKCGWPHIDAPEGNVSHDEARRYGSMSMGPGDEVGWTNPPHRSHLCLGCGFIWRPADVPTEGVAAIQTRGKNDSPPAAPGEKEEGGDSQSQPSADAGAHIPRSPDGGASVDRMDVASLEEVCGAVREAAERVTLGNCGFADDDVAILEHLAQRAVDAGLIDGLHPSIQKKIRGRPGAPLSGGWRPIESAPRDAQIGLASMVADEIKGGLEHAWRATVSCDRCGGTGAVTVEAGPPFFGPEQDLCPACGGEGLDSEYKDGSEYLFAAKLVLEALGLAATDKPGAAVPPPDASDAPDGGERGAEAKPEHGSTPDPSSAHPGEAE